MNSLGLALLKPVPQEILDVVGNATLRSAEHLLMHLEYLGEKLVKDDELYQMQRFHKGILNNIKPNIVTLLIITIILNIKVSYVGNQRISQFIRPWISLTCLITMQISLIKIRNHLI